MDTIKTGKFLKELRKGMGLTQEQLGEKVGVTNKTVSRWETGSYLPPVECLEMLSDIYGVSINEIVSGQRLSAEQFAQAAEENLSSALEMNDARRRAAEKRLMLTLLASTVIAMAIILLIPLGNGETVRGVVMIALVIALAFISNSVNIAALWLNNERFEKKDS